MPESLHFFSRSRAWGRLVVGFWLIIASGLSMRAQVETDFNGHPLQVFLQRDIDSSGTDRILFVDSLTGESTPVEANGVRYTLAGRSVMFFDVLKARVMIASADGRVREHPFIQPGEQTRRVDWVVARDGKHLAWTLTNADAQNNLTTVTTIASLDGSDQREILVDGPRSGIRALPIALDESRLYMDYQPDGIGDVTPFRQYAGIFAADVESRQLAMLPGEPGCFCGAGFGAGRFMRLKLSDDLSAFDVALYDLEAQTSQVVPALRLVNYTQAGDVLFSPDGTRGVYALAQVRDFGGPNQAVQMVFVLVNAVEGTQRTLTQPIFDFLQPVEWTEENTAVIFTGTTTDGTWKLNLDEGRMVRIADASYLGTLKRIQQTDG